MTVGLPLLQHAGSCHAPYLGLTSCTGERYYVITPAEHPYTAPYGMGSSPPFPEPQDPLASLPSSSVDKASATRHRPALCPKSTFFCFFVFFKKKINNLFGSARSQSTCSIPKDTKRYSLRLGATKVKWPHERDPTTTNTRF